MARAWQVRPKMRIETASLGDMRSMKSRFAALWRFIDAHPNVTVSRLRESLGYRGNARQIYQDLKRLEAHGWIIRHVGIRQGRSGAPPCRYSSTVPERAQSSETRNETMLRMAHEGHSIQVIAKQVNLGVGRCKRLMNALGVQAKAGLNANRIEVISTKKVDGMIDRLDMALQGAIPSEDHVKMLLAARPQREFVNRLLSTSSQFRNALRRIETLLRQYQRGTNDHEEARANDAGSPAQL